MTNNTSIALITGANRGLGRHGAASRRVGRRRDGDASTPIEGEAAEVARQLEQVGKPAVLELNIC